MANPFCCCGVATGARILALVSVVFAIALAVSSALVLKETYEYRDSDLHQLTRRGAVEVDALGLFFGQQTNLDAAVDRPLRILIGCSAATIAVGGLQILSSIFLCIGAAGKNDFQSRALSGTYGFVNMVGFLTIMVCIVCVLTTNKVWNVEKVNSIELHAKYWISAMISDGILLVYGMYASFSLMRA